MDLTMTAAERWAFLRDPSRIAVLSIAADGRGPVSSPIWYVALSPKRWSSLDYNKLFTGG